MDTFSPKVEGSILYSLLIFYVMTHTDDEGAATLPYAHMSRLWGIHRGTLHRGVRYLLDCNTFATVGKHRVRLLQWPKGSEKKKTVSATQVQRFDIERLYALYPRKRGKTPGVKRLTKDVKTDADFAALEKAIRNYARLSAGKEEQYVMHFSTFAGQWRDWVEVDKARFSINTVPVAL